MDEIELEDAIDKLILKLILESGLPLGVVAGVLESMTYRYKEQAGDEED